MRRELQKHFEVRRSLGIAIGVFAGLLAYRAVISSLEWWSNLESDEQFNVFTMAIFAIVMAATWYGIRRFAIRRKLNRLTASHIGDLSGNTPSRGTQALQATSVGLLIFASILRYDRGTWPPLALAICLCIALGLRLLYARMTLVKQRRLLSKSPILARQMQDPEFAARAHDDLDALSRVEVNAARLRAIDHHTAATTR